MDDEFEDNDVGETESVSGDKPEGEKEEKSISADLIRGHINTIILRSLSDSDKYGYEIIAEIEKKSCGQYSLKQPSLYSALKRLETQGFVTSYWGGTAGGGRRKYFSLTEDGKTIADQNRSEWEYSRTIIDSLISDKDFDFSNPAPSAVNMRVLKNTTSRVPSRESEFAEEGSEEGAQLKELEARYNELLAEKERMQEELSETRAREEFLRVERYESESADTELNDDERARYQDIIRGRDEIISNMSSHYEELLEQEKQELAEKERAKYEELIQAEREKLQQEQIEMAELLRIQYEELIQKDDTLSEEERAKYEELIQAEREKLQQAQIEVTDDERARYEELLRAERDKLEEEKARYEMQLEEQAALYREREREIRHQNYINLINTPPAVESTQEEFEHYTPPTAQERTDETPAEENPAPVKKDYRSVVEQLYASSIRTDAPAQFKVDTEARSLDRIDFRDIEMKAEQDGIKIVTSGKTEITEKRAYASVVHKGKALFLSALLLFFVIVAEGAVVLGIKGTYGIPIAYPCVMWGIGLVLLLVTGLAYANHFGQYSLRKSSPTLVNSIVIYVLAVIVTLIVALAVNIDFKSAKDLACFVAIPIVYLFGIVIFGLTYYLQVRPKKQL